MTLDYVEPTCGAGGTSEGLRMIGLRGVGIELDPWAAKTHQAAGHLTIRADMTTYPAEVFRGKVKGVVISPPCQPWSRAGKGLAKLDQPEIFRHVVRCEGGWVDYRRDGWHDPRSPLVLEVLRWVCAVEPEWLICEQVEDVLPFWQAVAHWLRLRGYQAACKVLSAETFGVPQTRKRAVLVASRVGSARLPEPTHQAYAKGRPVLAAEDHPAGLLPWVSMADALGWTDGPGNAVDWVAAKNMGAGMVERHGDRPARTLDEPAFTVRAEAGGTEPSGFRWVLQSNYGTGGDPRNKGERSASEQAPTLTSKTDRMKWLPDWTEDRPSTSVLGDPRIAPPGHRDREGGERQFGSPDTVRVTVEQAAALQSFPPVYPFQGSGTKQRQQIGNAVPCLLAAAVGGELTGRPWRHLAASLAVAA